MNESNSEKRDTFGNKIDLRVHYARGQILVDSHHEALRAGHARELLRERMQEQGTDSIYDFTDNVPVYWFITLVFNEHANMFSSWYEE